MQPVVQVWNLRQGAWHLCGCRGEGHAEVWLEPAQHVLEPGFGRQTPFRGKFHFQVGKPVASDCWQYACGMDGA
jgi:hypothetical protein